MIFEMGYKYACTTDEGRNCAGCVTYGDNIQSTDCDFLKEKINSNE